ncbi:MAG: shikimate dehydrogenase [Hyphomonadaceae bacterium]|nr:shikimate dehydrogenase [Hyphomonadaceae bacterium]
MSISSATRLFAVIGDPVRHSLSPVLHNAWIADASLDAVYVALRLQSSNPAASLRELMRFGVAGANVTVPFKEAAAEAADRSESESANVLRLEDDGSVSAFNTDGLGFLDALGEGAPDWRLRVRRVVVIGAGGAAGGVGRALSPYVDSITFVNRTFDRSQRLASTLRNGRAARWDDMERCFGAADLIVQTTTLGMTSAPSHDWPFQVCKAGAIAFDVVYRPLLTPFFVSARERGLISIDGLGMLIHQGARAFELWFGVQPDTTRARARLLEAIAE